MSTSSSSASSSSSSSSGEEQPIVSQIELVETAIREIMEGAQSYRIGDRTVTRANLLELMKARNMLKAENQKNSGTRPTVSAARFGGNFD